MSNEELIREIRELKILIQKQNERLDNHINFVERVYDLLKKPIVYILSIVTPEQIKIDDMDICEN